jgi:acetyl esterase/lipase
MRGVKAILLGSAATIIIVGLLAQARTLAQQSSTASPEARQSRALERADANMRDVLAKLKELGGKPIHRLSVEEARRGPSPAAAVQALMAERGLQDPSRVKRQDVTYPGAQSDLAARIYTPTTLPDGRAPQAPLPVIVYFHGGGWVIADIDTYDASAAALATKAGAIVVSVDYRRAPENRFPAAHLDAFAAWQWVLHHARTWGGDSNRIAIAGESAGGNLAVNVAATARDQRIQLPIHMLLVYPVAGVDTATQSYRDNAEATPLGRADMEWFFAQVTSGPGDLANPMLDLVGRADLVGLPPATVITAEIDPLRSEGQALARKLEAAGVAVRHRDFEGVTHEFFGMAPLVIDAARAQEFAANELRQAFERTAATGAGSGDSGRATGESGVQPGNGSLSDTLGRTDGVLTPPRGIDPGIRAPAPVPDPGTTPVIPPPGSPGNPAPVRPK